MKQIKQNFLEEESPPLIETASTIVDKNEGQRCTFGRF